MNILKITFETIKDGFFNSQLLLSDIFSILIVSISLSVYEFFIYRYVSHKGLYNKSFNICISLIPIFISTIIMTLQSNLVITLGTIGALAIIRFRTAIKDPIDMVYLLWSIHIGITCGCKLFMLSTIVSLIVSVFLFFFSCAPFNKETIIAVIHIKENEESIVLNTIDGITKNYKVKNITHVNKDIDLIIELNGINEKKLSKTLNDNNINNYNIVKYDNEDVI